MKKHLITTAATLAVLALGASADAATYTDATGENFDGNLHMDITSVEVTNSLTDITFTINLNGSIASPNDWGNYAIGISQTPGVGDTGDPVGNPWARNIRMADGMEAWIGSWVNGGGGVQAWTFESGSWTQNSQIGVTLGAQSTMFTIPLEDLNLSLGDTFQFDVYSTGGGAGDSANDALANPNQTVSDWQVPYTTPSGAGATYTVLIPEPATAGLLALGGLTLLRRKR